MHAQCASLSVTAKMDRWREAYWCYFLVLIFLWLLKVFLPTPLAITAIIVNHTNIDFTMYSKVASGHGQSYKLTKILPKLSNIFLIDKIAGLKIY